MRKEKFYFRGDQQEGFLLVLRERLEALGIDKEISKNSKQWKKNVYLEVEKDLPLFENKLKEIEETEVVRVDERLKEGRSRYRNYSSYSPNSTEAEQEVKVEQEIEEDTHQKLTMNNFPLNQILYGPPGTGKTYNTINKALEIIGEKTEGKTRQQIKDLFDKKMEEGQIVFTTFHQSMSYEDFIEGIKPIAPDNEGAPVIYKTMPGIFRNLCVKASSARAKVNESETTKSDTEKEEVVRSLSKTDGQNKDLKPYVLIIDEINRGNVSQIFGELITLIEEDKRLGMDEALEVTLPYSKCKFGVPPNLFIIGTMNTADRSVEALDAALRRRFSFVEMPPRSALIATAGMLKEGVLGNIKLPLMLDTINKRIEKLLDKDHQIGHSYFMTVSNFAQLKSAFQNKIIPLLQEYFFGDYGKIGLVLGKKFFEPIENTEENLFADFEEYDASDFAERTIYKIKEISNMSDDHFNIAINTLLKKSVENQ